MLWCEILYGPNFYNFVKINISEWTLNFCDLEIVSDLLFSYKLNPNTGLICYSNYPRLIDESPEEYFEKKNDKTINLKLLNVYTGETRIIDQTEAQVIHYRWLDDNTIEYSFGDVEDNKKIYNIE